MSIYIGNDLEDRLKALQIENTSLKNTMNTIKWYMKSTMCQTCIEIVVSISNQWISINTLKLRNGMILQ